MSHTILNETPHKVQVVEYRTLPIAWRFLLA